MTKQTFIPGTEPPRDPELDALVNAYQEAKLVRVKASNAETISREAVANYMHVKGIEKYITHDDQPLEARFEKGEEKLVVKPAKVAAAEGAA